MTGGQTNSVHLPVLQVHGQRAVSLLRDLLHDGPGYDVDACDNSEREAKGNRRGNHQLQGKGLAV